VTHITVRVWGEQHNRSDLRYMLVEGHTSDNTIYILAWRMCFGETTDNYIEFLNVG
jgi:hypothetical protein